MLGGPDSHTGVSLDLLQLSYTGEKWCSRSEAGPENLFYVMQG